MGRLDELKTLYQTLLSTIGEVDPDKRAAVSREMRATLLEIQELEADMPAEGPVSKLDELRAKREKHAG